MILHWKHYKHKFYTFIFFFIILLNSSVTTKSRKYFVLYLLCHIQIFHFLFLLLSIRLSQFTKKKQNETCESFIRIILNLLLFPYFSIGSASLLINFLRQLLYNMLKIIVNIFPSITSYKLTKHRIYFAHGCMVRNLFPGLVHLCFTYHKFIRLKSRVNQNL